MGDDGSRFQPSILTAVAIDRDKNSQQAVKWAVDHLLINTSRIILIHVRQRPASGTCRYPSFSLLFQLFRNAATN